MNFVINSIHEIEIMLEIKYDLRRVKLPWYEYTNIFYMEIETSKTIYITESKEAFVSVRGCFEERIVDFCTYYANYEVPKDH